VNGLSVNVTLEPVDASNWRAVADLEVTEEQRRFVVPVTRYLTLCAYDDGPWRPLAVRSGHPVVGFLMEAIDPADGSYWIGGLIIDASGQRRGYGRATVAAALVRAREAGCGSAALSYEPANVVAKQLYCSLGFAETGERDGDEVVARLAW
jgi:diamine N-acetyltransferase